MQARDSTAKSLCSRGVTHFAYIHLDVGCNLFIRWRCFRRVASQPAMLANALSSEAICAAGPRPQLLAFYIMVFGVSVMSRRCIWPAKLCAVAQVLRVAFVLFRALP